MVRELTPDPYIALDVPHNATAAEIKSQYRKLALKLHPDRVRDESQKPDAAERFYRVQAAYDILSDEATRARYDAQRGLVELRKDVIDRDKACPTDVSAQYDNRTQPNSSFSPIETDGPEGLPLPPIGTEKPRISTRRYKIPRRKGPETSTSVSARRTSEETSYEDIEEQRAKRLGRYLERSRPIPATSDDPARMPFSTTVFYDLELDGELDGRVTSAFPDTGASWNFLSRPYAAGRLMQMDASKTITIHLPTGKPMQSLGVVRLGFRFKNDSEIHVLNFHVLPRCIADVILGGDFLWATSAFTRFGNCIRRTLRHILPHRLCFLGGARRLMHGWLAEERAVALPDTGSDLMLMSRSYAVRRRFVVADDLEYHITLQLGDLSVTTTSGYVNSVRWTFCDSHGNEMGHSELCGFWIVDDLACDLILSDEFLLRTKALESMSASQLQSDDDPRDISSAFSAIKALRIRRSVKKPTVQPVKSYDAWNKEVQKERVYQCDVEMTLAHLSEAERAQARKKLQHRWAALQAQRPTSNSVSNPSPLLQQSTLSVSLHGPYASSPQRPGTPVPQRPGTPVPQRPRTPPLPRSSRVQSPTVANSSSSDQ